MSDPTSSANKSVTTGATAPSTDTTIVVGCKDILCRFDHSDADVPMQMPLPGIVILVHGVNSDGEWYEQAEEGLCKGLNERLARRDENLVHQGADAGQMHPAKYINELDPDGFINPKMNPKTFVSSVDAFTPVIRFRWGYKASGEELKAFGGNIYLNEQNYWGGGPFANGCSTLPDLWGGGLDDQLFLWLHVQHMNSTPDRQVYSCPPRPYFVLAAYRLAKLVQSIRTKQADVPITIVCHSQGNMVGMAAAFLGDQLGEVTDVAGHHGRCVADAYVLCNPPYSLVDSNFTEDWSQMESRDPQGRTGRETLEARTKTLAAFFDLVRQRRSLQPDAQKVDACMANEAHQFTAQQDRDKHGLGGFTYGRVTLYCNPHDQVISSTTVQGIGWRGMSEEEIEATRGQGVFSQRVFAQGFTVGAVHPGRSGDRYDYWNDQYNRPERGSQKFWSPESPAASYSISKGLDANTHYVAKGMTVLLSPLMAGVTWAARPRINALPPKHWAIPLSAPPLPEPFKPQALRLGQFSDDFDQQFDPAGDYRDAQRRRADDDPYTAPGEQKGNVNSEASLRYEDHAHLRMQARREGLYKTDDKVAAEDEPATADAKYKAWRSARIKSFLADTINAHATDHSTIVTNPVHAQKALAYDVAIGICDIGERDFGKLRRAADWRFVGGLADDDPSKVFAEYFGYGLFTDKSPADWANAKNSEAKMPNKIVDQRTHVPAQPNAETL